MLRPALLLLASMALGLSGCASGPGQVSPDDITRETHSVEARLRSTWQLVSFAPEVPLDPMLQAMLEFQYGRLVMRFDGQRVIADSPGLHVNRAYRVLEVTADRFKLVTYDEQGIAYESWCRFNEDGTLQMSSFTPPWRGLAALRRVGS